MEKDAPTNKSICLVAIIFCCFCLPLYAQEDFYSYPSYFSFTNSYPQSAFSFQAVPASAPWLAASTDPDFPYQPHGQVASKNKMHPALRSFLRFFIVSAGVMPATVGLSSLLYLAPPAGWSSTKQTQVVLISGASAALTIGFIDLIIDLVIQAKKKEASRPS